jgi:hypothetical protein
VARIGMFRLDDENLSINLFGISQPASLMVPHGNRQFIGNRRHRRYYPSLSWLFQAVLSQQFRQA